jgi:hypothetical protein
MAMHEKNPGMILRIVNYISYGILFVPLILGETGGREKCDCPHGTLWDLFIIIPSSVAIEGTTHNDFMVAI